MASIAFRAAPRALTRSAAPSARASFAPRRATDLRVSHEQAPGRVSAAGEWGDATPSDGEVVPVGPDRQLPAADGRYSGLRVLVAGAGGGVGRAVVQQLSAQGVPVRALVRDSVRASKVLPSASAGVEVVEGDVYDYQSVVRAMQGCNAVVIATGPTNKLDPLGPWKVDFQGNENLVAAARQAGASRIVLVTSIGVDDLLFPLNLFWGILFWKKQGELAVQRSGLTYTIVRPGGLLNEPRSGQAEGAAVLGLPGTYGLPPRRTPGSVLRRVVADACVEALVEPAAADKVVELVSESGAPKRPFAELFASVA